MQAEAVASGGKRQHVISSGGVADGRRGGLVVGLAEDHGLPSAAWAGAGRARASAVSTAARAPVPAASSCRLVLRAGAPTLTCSVMASSRVAAQHEQARQASASPALR